MATAYREWVSELFDQLATEAGAPDPGQLARQLRMIYDGAMISARMDHDPNVAMHARAAAATLVDAALS